MQYPSFYFFPLIPFLFLKLVSEYAPVINMKPFAKEGDDFEEVPGSRMVVTRTAYKDNSSFYQVTFINRKIYKITS